jgi:hypothetical protein
MFAAKLLFIWDPDPVTGSRRRRLCEERIVTFRSRSARDAVRKAKAIGKGGELRYADGHRLRFVGILQCMDVCDSSEQVWWEFQRRSDPDTWAQRMTPPESRLFVYTDKIPKTGTRSPQPGLKSKSLRRSRRRG